MSLFVKMWYNSDTVGFLVSLIDMVS